MALREILRVETDKNSMIKLNNYKNASEDTPAAIKYDLKRDCDNDTEEGLSMAKLLNKLLPEILSNIVNLRTN